MTRPLCLLLILLLAACAGEAPAPPEEDDDAGGIDQEALERLRALPYVDHAAELPENAEVGVTVLDRERAQPGLTLYTNAKDCSTKLIELDGTVLHSWSRRPCYRWDNNVLLPDGDLLVTGRSQRGPDARYLLRASWDGGEVWNVPLDVHHDVEQTPDGRILALAHRMRQIEELHPSIPVRDHLLVLLSADGEVLEERSLWDLTQTAPEILEVTPRKPRNFEGSQEIDIFHSNSGEWMRQPHLAGTHPIYGENTVLISIRNQDTLIIVDWKEEKLLWAWGRGEIVGPHDATLLPSGNILLFDNGLGRKWSRVIELDPVKREIVWEYRAPEPTDFYTASRGASQRLANGNTLITESDSGHAFEVTSDGEIVWGFLNPDVSDKREPHVIVRMRRLEGLDEAELLGRLERGEPLPLVD